MAKNKRTSSRGASRSRSKKQSRQVPGWIWLFTGTIAGLFVAFLVHLAHVQIEQGASRDGDGDRTAKADNDVPQKSEGNNSEEDHPKFDFYAVLPKMEVIVPKGEEKEQPSRQERSSKPKNQEKKEDDPPVSSRHNKRFVLQAGSFRNQKDADRRRAELILKGYEARIQPVDMDNGGTWHRVMVGPYDNVNSLHRAQDKLADNGVETLPIQLKD